MKWLVVLLQVIQIIAGLVIAKIVLSLSLPPILDSPVDSLYTWYSGISVATQELHSVVDTPFEEPESISEAKYGRVVLMLVDAMRSDLVFERPEMEYVRQVLSQDTAIKMASGEVVEPVPGKPRCSASYIGKAHTPTVTMPRIKAITTGGVPQFIDALNNLDSGAIIQDNLISRFLKHDKKTLLYGDETWLKLFPGHFFRHDGTSSFFTKDYTEVDLNVTRHFDEDFDPKMKHQYSKDWDVAVLHYLGLDHIGHQHGPDSLQMHVKLQEMDRTFEQLHKSLVEQDEIRKQEDPSALPTLLILLSDHGMNQGGNHGGASEPETSAVCLFFHATSGLEECDPRHDSLMPLPQGAKLRPQEILQVDLAPTLGKLLGVGIPRTGVGRVLCEPFELGARGSCTEVSLYQHALWANANQMTNYLKSKTGGKLPDDIAQMFMQANAAREHVPEWFEKVLELMQALQDQLGQLVAGGDGSGSQLYLVFALFALFLPLPLVVLSQRRYLRKPQVSDLQMGWVPMAACIIHSLALTSSSAIENEHVVWFHFATLWLLGQLLTAVSQRRKAKYNAVFWNPLLSLILLRLLRSRLQVINFATLNAFTGSEFVNENTALLVVPSQFENPMFILGSLMLVALHFVTTDVSRKSRLSTSSAVLACTSVAFLKCGVLSELVDRVSDVGQTEKIMWEAYAARAVLFVILCHVAVRLRVDSIASVMPDLVALLALLLHRPANTLLVATAMLLMRTASSAHWPGRGVGQSMGLWAVGQCVFFATGNSHSMSTVDISGAYTGLLEYNQYIVGSFTTVIVFLGPLLALASVGKLLQSEEAERKRFVVVLYALHSMRFFVSSAVLIMMRSHLFVWSVFAPKWAYEVLQFAVMMVGTWWLM